MLERSRFSGAGERIHLDESGALCDLCVSLWWLSPHTTASYVTKTRGTDPPMVMESGVCGSGARSHEGTRGGAPASLTARGVAVTGLGSYHPVPT
jgi:hypothetical protein